MAFFEWKDSFNVGIEEIDRQHRRFFEYLNECNDLHSTGKDLTVSKELIEKLKHYAEKHFEYEEYLFNHIGYIETEAQIKQHGYFVLRVLDLEDELIRGNQERLTSVLCFLRDWFLSHILEEDKKYAPFVIEYLSRL